MHGGTGAAAREEAGGSASLDDKPRRLWQNGPDGEEGPGGAGGIGGGGGKGG